MLFTNREPMRALRSDMTESQKVGSSLFRMNLTPSSWCLNGARYWLDELQERTLLDSERELEPLERSKNEPVASSC